MILREQRVALSSQQGTLRISGCMHLTHRDERVLAGAADGLWRAAQAALSTTSLGPQIPAPIWTGLRMCSPDGLPFVGRLAGDANVWVATLHAMLGVALAPLCAQMIANAICTGDADACDRRLSPDRFSAHRRS